MESNGVTGSEALGASFQDFCEDPENRNFIIRNEKEELRDVRKSQDRVEASRFRNSVLLADCEAQTNMAPFIRHRVLRHIICSFTNDNKGDFETWACNPRIIDMLTQAKKMMDDGKIGEEEAERLIMQSMYDDRTASDRNIARNDNKLSCSAKDLVGALNNQIHLRMQGNRLYGKRSTNPRESVTFPITRRER